MSKLNISNISGTTEQVFTVNGNSVITATDTILTDATEHIGITEGDPHGFIAYLGFMPSNALSDMIESSDAMLVSDTEKDTWNGKQDALNYTPAPDTRLINDYDLTADISLDYSDVSAAPLLHTHGYEPANSNIQNHIAITSGNPHGVDFSGIYELADSDIQEHIGLTIGNPHEVTYSDTGAASDVHTHGGLVHDNRTDIDLVSGTNTGDETQTTIRNKLGVASETSSGYLTSEGYAAFLHKPESHGQLSGIQGHSDGYHLSYADYQVNTRYATASQGGNLSDSDFSTFYGKQNALGFTPVSDTRTINNYDLTANRNLTYSDTNSEQANSNIQSHIGITQGDPHGYTGGNIAALRIGDITSGHYSEFLSDGTLKYRGNATAYRDEYGNLLGAKKIGSRITDDLTEQVTAFSDACVIATDYIAISHQLNHDRLLGSIVHCHLHWQQASANMPNWLIQYRWQSNAQLKTTSWTSLKYFANRAVYSSGILNQITGFGDITPPANDGLSDILQVRLCRDTNNSSGLFAGVDPLTGVANAVFFDIHIEIDAAGSASEYIK